MAAETDKSAWYREYLASQHWQDTRELKLEQTGRQCERCGAHARRTPAGVWGGLDVHHLTYERVGREELADLEVLCVECHAREHGMPTDEASLARKREKRGLQFEPDEIDLELQAWDELAEAAGL